MKAENFEAAVSFYGKAIELNPSNAVYFCNRYGSLSPALCACGFGPYFSPRTLAWSKSHLLLVLFLALLDYFFFPSSVTHFPVPLASSVPWHL